MENPQLRLRVATERHPDDPPEKHKPPGRIFLPRRAGTITTTDIVDISASVYVEVRTDAAGQPIETLTLPGNGPGGNNQVGSPLAEPTNVIVPAVAPPISNTPQASISSPLIASSPVAPSPVASTPAASTPVALGRTSESVSPVSTPQSVTTFATSTIPPIAGTSSNSNASSSSKPANTSAAAVAGAKSTEGSASSTPMVAGAVVGSVGGLTILLLIVLILLRWYKHRRRAMSVHGAGSNDSAANLAGPPGAPSGLAGAGATGGTFRVLGNEESKEMTGTNRRGMIPSPAFFSDRLSRDRNGQPGTVNPNLPPYNRTQGGYSGPNNDDANEITVVGGGPARPPYRTAAISPFGDHQAASTIADEPDRKPEGRNDMLLPFPPLEEKREYDGHEHGHEHEGFTQSSDDPSSGDPSAGGYYGHQDSHEMTGPNRRSDGSITSLYRDSWPPGLNPAGAGGVKPLFLNSGRGGGVLREAEGKGTENERPESFAVWPGPGAAKEIERLREERATREYALEQHRLAIAQHGSATDEDTAAAHEHDEDVITPKGTAISLLPLQNQAQTHLGDTSRDDSSSLHRETLRPSPARTPQVHSAEPEMYPFPARASPHDERNGSSRPPITTATGFPENHGVGMGSIDRKPVGGG